MKQISNRKQSVSYLYYFLFGLSLVAEPFFLKLLFATYLPGFYYSALTTPIGVVLAIVGLQKLQKANGDTTIRQTIATIRQDYEKLLNPNFRRRILSHYKIPSRALLNLFKGLCSEEPMARKRSRKALKYLGLIATFLSFLFIFIPYLFSINFPRWGLFDTSLTILFHICIICLLIIACYSRVVDEIKQVKNALRSAADLKTLLNELRVELKNWQFEDRVILPFDSSRYKKRLYILSFILPLFNLIAKRGDIDIVAISPNGHYFVIELKSHLGNVKWNSKSNNIRHQLKKTSEYVPFKENFFDKVYVQAERLRDYKNLSQTPDRILFFSRATVKLCTKDRLKRGTLISYPKCLVDDLKERDKKLTNKSVKNKI